MNYRVYEFGEDFVFKISNLILLCVFTITLPLINLNCADKAVNDRSKSKVMTDIDGNTYKTVVIGDQTWMAENLKTTHYRNGDSIDNETDDSIWTALSTGAYCDYGNNPDTGAIYGHLYNWYAVVDDRNIAPEGWHVPSDAEWQKLANFLGGDSVAGGMMKEPGTIHWNSPNTGSTNLSHFTALPGGFRDDKYFLIHHYACFWSSTESKDNSAWYRLLASPDEDIYRLEFPKHVGLSIRCIKD